METEFQTRQYVSQQFLGRQNAIRGKIYFSQIAPKSFIVNVDHFR